MAATNLPTIVTGSQILVLLSLFLVRICIAANAAVTIVLLRPRVRMSVALTFQKRSLHTLCSVDWQRSLNVAAQVPRVANLVIILIL